MPESTTKTKNDDNGEGRDEPQRSCAGVRILTKYALAMDRATIRWVSNHREEVVSATVE